MASNIVLASSQQPKKKGNHSLFDLSHQEIKTKICTTHVHGDEKYCDVQSLFIVVENILKRATLQVDDNVVLGTQATVEHLEEKTARASFGPLHSSCTLKSISCEMQCKGTGEETAYETTVLSILNKLSNYSWDAKAALTLAAFALDYGEFWLLVQSLQSSDSDKVLAKSVGTLRQVSVLLKRPKQAIIELNNVIKAALKVIECIFELEKLSNQIDTEDLVDDIPVYVFWAIVTVVASTTQLCCLTSDDNDKQQELSQFSQKLNKIFDELESRITICKQKIEETETYLKLKKLLRTATEILDVLKGLINSKDNELPLIDGSTKKRVNIDVLKSKNVLLLISGLDISDDDISILRQVYDSIRKDDQYKIVWLPIVDQWNDQDLKNKFELLRSTMPWYVVHHFSSIAGIRIVKEKWYFMGKPSVVVLNPSGREGHVYEINTIRLWGIEVFPFNTVVPEIISNEIDLIGSLATSLHPNIKKWIQDDQKYIFFYGGNDEWIKQFTNRASVVANDAAIRNAKISIELACVEKGSKGEDNRGRFWTGIESMFISKTRRKTDSTDSMIGEIWKLLSYKNESGWAILSKGSNVVLSGQGTTIMKVVEGFEKWKEFVDKKGLDFTIKEQHKNVLGTTHICRRIDIPNTSGIMPDQNMKCPYCDGIMVMETYISFKYCCHAH